MKDILDEIYDVLLKDNLVSEYIERRIYQDDYPESLPTTLPYIILSEIDEPIPRVFASNKYLALDYLVQVDVFVPQSSDYDSYIFCRNLSYHISKLLREKMNLMYSASNQPEYDKDFKIYRRARRYEGVFYLEEYQ